MQEVITPYLLVPAGVISVYAGASSPTGYLMCNGSAVSRAIYAELFNVIGTTYGPGDGSTTFNVPNLTGRVPVGLQASEPSFASLGTTGGEIEHTLTIAEMPAHVHTGTTDSAGIHTHTITDPGHSHSLPLTSGGFADIGPADDVTQGSAYNSGTSLTGITINNNGAHVHTFTTNSTGGSDPHNNLQPYITLNYIIKYSNFF